MDEAFEKAVAEELETSETQLEEEVEAALATTAIPQVAPEDEPEGSQLEVPEADAPDADASEPEGVAPTSDAAAPDTPGATAPEVPPSDEAAALEGAETDAQPAFAETVVINTGTLPPPPPPAEGSVGATEEAAATIETAEDTATDDQPQTSKRSVLRKVGIGVGALAVLSLIAAGGISYAGYDYSKRYEGKILPGGTVAGVDVGGMERDEAIAAVKEAVQPQLDRNVTVTFRNRTWEVTPRDLGARSNARKAVDAALIASGRTSFVDRTRMRLFGDKLDFDQDVAISYPRKGAKGFILGIASGYDRDATDASIDYSSGWVEFTDEKEGRRVRVAPSVSALKEALESGSDSAKLEVATVAPEVTSDSYRQVLLTRIGENKLYFYQDGAITHEWTVAPGLPAYRTPTGVFEVTELRYMPTWVNPSPNGWGSNMPASIGPGPGNPLGLRAINWSAPAIRFHGTSATYSLGYNASHGCVRMSNEDVIELYDMIEVGATIVSIEVAPLKPLYSSSARSTPTAENSRT